MFLWLGQGLGRVLVTDGRFRIFDTDEKGKLHGRLALFQVGHDTRQGITRHVGHYQGAGTEFLAVAHTHGRKVAPKAVVFGKVAVAEFVLFRLATGCRPEHGHNSEIIGIAQKGGRGFTLKDTLNGDFL